MYNTKNELYITKFNELKKEKEIWEDVIPKSVDLLELLYSLEEDNYFSAKYISVLNGKRNLKDSYEEFNEFIDHSIRSQKLDNYKFHRLFKRFMTDIDSCLDYLDKLYKDLKLLDDKFSFNRKNDDIKKFSENISDLRNAMLHEGLTRLDTREERTSSGCCAHTAGYSKIVSSVTIAFTPKGSNENKTLEANKFYS